MTFSVKIFFSLRCILTGLLVIFGCISKLSADQKEWDSSQLDSLLHFLRENKSLDAKSKSDLADSAFVISKRLNLICKQIESRILQSNFLDEIGLSDSALTHLLWANTLITPACGINLSWRLKSSFTILYLTLGDYDRIDSIAGWASRTWAVQQTDFNVYFTILTNAAIAKAHQGDMMAATRLFHQILAHAQKVKNDTYVHKSLINLSTIKGIAEEYDSAYYFLERAAENMRTIQDMDAYMALMMNLSLMDMDQKRFAAAEARLDSADRLAVKFNNLRIRANVLSNKAFLAEFRNQYKKAYIHLRDYITLQDTILTEERIKAVTDMQEKYESEKKARQIQELEVKNLDVTLSNERIRNTRNRYLFIGAGILLFAIGLYSRLHYVRKSKEAIQKEKDISEGLLLNILPASVAEELKVKGHAEAKNYDEATILFSDFKSFTTIAGEMSATDLVNEINDCFKAFDEIMTIQGLEKIKTIGDSYMAAGAIPDTNKATVLDVVKAGLSMQHFVKTRKAEREALQLPAFEMRVGIHTGPVVAGIVGVKKFQYDLWGDTVNIASRMETNGEAGRVNISEATFDLVQSVPSLHFIPRGNIQVKGKGEMMMYFVETRS